MSKKEEKYVVCGGEATIDEDGKLRMNSNNIAKVPMNVRSQEKEFDENEK